MRRRLIFAPMVIFIWSSIFPLYSVRFFETGLNNRGIISACYANHILRSVHFQKEQRVVSNRWWSEPVRYEDRRLVLRNMKIFILRHYRVIPMVQLRSRIFRQTIQKFAGCSSATGKDFCEVWRKRCKQVCHSWIARWCFNSLLIISSFSCTIFLDMVCRLLPNVCVVTSFYQRPASRVYSFSSFFWQFIVHYLHFSAGCFL